MRLGTEFYKLPLRFDAARLAAEVLQFSEEEWRAHPQAFAGNSAIPLISVQGEINDEVRGPMQPTPFLERCPYLQQVLEAMGTVIGRARLMRIAAASKANAHVDASYYWRHHVRIHVPAVTYPEVQFICGDRAIHMAAGEAWIFDSWKVHDVINPRDTPRIHLVADTVGTAHFWDQLVGRAEQPFGSGAKPAATPKFVPFAPKKKARLALETRNFPVVMTPWEQEALAGWMFANLRADAVAPAQTVIERTGALHREWLGLWAAFGDAPAGWENFGKVLAVYDAQLEPWKGRLRLANSMDLVESLRQAIVRPALTPSLARPEEAAPAPVPPKIAGVFDRPVFIVAAPRSGSSMLFELLARSPGFATIGGESHRLIEGLKKLSPAARKFASNRLTAADAKGRIAAQLRERFLAELRTADGTPVTADAPMRLLEKTPKNALRIPFLHAVFPGARFIYLYREPAENISSILEAWRSGKFVTYPGLPGWEGLPWSLALIPGWREWVGRPAAEVAAQQWMTINAQIIADLEALPREDWCAASYAELVADPQATAARLCQFAEVPWVDAVASPLPLARHTLTPPEAGKWRKNEAEMMPFLPLVDEVAKQARTILEEEKSAADASAPLDLTSVHTSNLPGLLTELGISLLVTTYQAGRLIVLREQEGTLNTHFRCFASPMGLAYDGERLAIGTRNEVWQFVNQPDVAPKLEPKNTHDAAFLPRNSHHTGNIRIHEIAYAGGELWAVNTRFSCLCTFDAGHSFVPRWRPPFVTALAPEDRCHLNGLAVVDDAVKYVTCLGTTDGPGGWRENKATGGCLLDVPSGEIVVGGLSMPHSPRVHGGHLWVLESGKGTLARIDPATGRAQEIARMPGFTRGMDFHGPYAFIGLSQVRETAVFSGLPLTERLAVNERTCGVWVIDLRNGQTVAFLRFESGVQEIFAIQVLPGLRQPDVITDDDDILGSSFIIPEALLSEVPAPLRTRGAPKATKAKAPRKRRPPARASLKP